MFNPFKSKIGDQFKNASKDLVKIVGQESGELVKSAVQQTIAPEAGSVPQKRSETTNPIVEAMQQQSTPNSAPPSEQQINSMETHRTQRLNSLQQELARLNQTQKYEKEQQAFQAMQAERERQAQIKAQQETGLVVPHGVDRKAQARGGGKKQSKGTQELPKKVGG